MPDEATEWTATPVPSPRKSRVHFAVWIAVLCVVLPLGSCIGCLAIGRRAADRGRDVAASIIPSISQPWSAPAMLAHADDSFTQAVPYEKLQKLAGWFDRRLGNLRSCQPVTTGNWRAFAGTSGFIVVSTYYADCEVERGKGRVTLQLIRQGDRWRVQGVHVNSDVLIE